jgi:hypothetical protein
MDLAEVDRAVSRPGRYFLDDGLWEIVVGLWLALTVALPEFVGGAVANWAPCAMLLGVLAIRPAVLSAKARWVFPRTGRVTYPEPGTLPSRSSLGLGPGRGQVVSGPSTGRLNWLWAAIIAGAGAVPLALTRGLPRGHGFHLAVGAALGAAFLFASWRWGQRRWIALGVVLAALGLLVANSRLDDPARLAAHTAGLAAALMASGGAAFASYLRHAPGPGADADGR